MSYLVDNTVGMTVEQSVEPQVSVATPFVKWIGGKRSVIDHLQNSMPKEFGHYYEPFIGGGALFFAQHGKIRSASISDLNGDLVNAYRVVQKCPKDLIEELRKHAASNCEEYYYQVRASSPQTKIQQAARLLYLLKTCFNGLYRENASGRFNASWGYYKKPDIVQESNIMACSEALQRIIIKERPCWAIRPKEGDLVYLDPPYHDSYVGYNADCFNERDHVRLRDMALRLARRGVFVMISNSNTEFVQKIYDMAPFRKKVVMAKRTVSRKASSRGLEGELLITTYEV